MADHIGASVVSGRSEMNLFFRTLPIEWKFFRGAADLSALSLASSEKNRSSLVYLRCGPARAQDERDAARVCRVLFPVSQLASCPGIAMDLSSERKDVCRQTHG